MRLLSLGLLLALSACASSPPPGPAVAAPPSKPAVVQPSEHTGTIAGAPWRLDVPEQWNGELVVYFHGYAPQEQPIPEVMPRNGYEGWLLERGFAVAQSDYSARGWSVAEALADSEAMRQHVVAGPLNEQEWCLLVGSAAASTKLRQLLPAFQRALTQSGAQVNAIRIKVQMPGR